MNNIKQKVLDLLANPKVMQKTNGWFAIFWIVMIPVSAALHLLSSVTYVSGLSIWALVSGHWSAWQAARVEVEQQRQVEAQRIEDLPKDTAKKVVKELKKSK